MTRQAIKLPKRKIINLYQKGLSTQRLANMIGYSQMTVINRLREWGVERRDRAHMRVRYPKKPFSGDLQEKAYLFGFRLGDLNVYKPKGHSRIFVIRCHTTVRDQVKLIRSLFAKYGGVRICHSANGFTINCFMDDSFAFLNTKQVPRWVFKVTKAAISFMAGYIDAEGSFGLNQGRGRFKVDSYDYEILKGLHRFLKRQGIITKFRIIAHRGTINLGGKKWNSDLWRLNINEARSLEKFIKLVLPYLKHKKRIGDAHSVLSNVRERIHHGTVK